MSQKVLVVGSGFGGLAAIRMRALGCDVEVIEAGAQPGGRAVCLSKMVSPSMLALRSLPRLTCWMSCFLVGRDARDYFDLMPVDPLPRCF